MKKFGWSLLAIILSTHVWASSTGTITADVIKARVTNGSLTLLPTGTGSILMPGSSSIDHSGNLSLAGGGVINVGGAANTGVGVFVTKSLLTGTAPSGIYSQPTFDANASSFAFNYRSSATLAAAGSSYTIPSFFDYFAGGPTLGTNAHITNHTAFCGDASGGTNIAQFSDTNGTLDSGASFIDQTGNDPNHLGITTIGRLANNAATFPLIVQGSSVSGSSEGLQIHAGVIAADFPFVITTASAGANLLFVTGDGNMTLPVLGGSGTVALNVDNNGKLIKSSDERLKVEEKSAAIPGLAEILKIHPRAYRWKDDIKRRGKKAAVEIGFFANQVAPIIPSAAPKGNDGYYGFYDRSVTAALVKAVQELNAKFEAYKATHP